MLWPSLLPALAFAALTPLLFSLRYLDSFNAAVVLERFFALAGILLLVPVPQPEHDRRVREAVAAKATPLTGVTALRLLLLLPVLLGLVALLCGGMTLGGSSFPFGSFLLGGFASAFALGALGFAVHLLSGNWIAGYLVPVCYFILNMAVGPQLGVFWLFSLSGGSLLEKYWLLAAGVVLAGGALALQALRRQRVGASQL